MEEIGPEPVEAARVVEEEVIETTEVTEEDQVEEPVGQEDPDIPLIHQKVVVIAITDTEQELGTV